MKVVLIGVVLMLYSCQSDRLFKCEKELEIAREKFEHCQTNLLEDLDRELDREIEK